MISPGGTRSTQDLNMNRKRPAGPKMPMISSSCGSNVMEERRATYVLRSCPNCGHEIDCNTDLIGMPAGVKFDPSNQELIHHLQSMVDDGGSRAHPLLYQFIPTIQGEGGINIHPESLPGVRKDGLSKHFFHRPSKAYPCSTRKCRKIHAPLDLNSSPSANEMRWHKTGKTRPLIVGGQQKGCKKILVLHTNLGKNQKPEKTNWVMHQYNLGDQDEKDGELVVSKVFYQTQARQYVDTAVVAPNAEQHMIMNGDGGNKATKTSEAMQQGVVSHFAADTTTPTIVVMQQQHDQQMNQDDGQFSVAYSKKRCLEVGVRDQETSDKGQHDDNHNVSQHQACRELQCSPRHNVFTNTRLLITTKITMDSTTVSTDPAGNMSRKLTEDPKISSSSELTDEKLEERRASTLRSCPNCGHEIDCNTDMIGMPAGVKFDPSDQELIHHLHAMVDEGGSSAHPLIDKFIPTLQGEDGINIYPENLPGVRRDGLSKYFFYKSSSKAYANGTRKRRKIYAQNDLNSSDSGKEMSWHKTGKTQPVIVGGQQKGCKKIMVLYTNLGKHRKPEKTNWVMHQYHLGDQEEKDGELVVSKVFYQTRQHMDEAVSANAEQHEVGVRDQETSDKRTTG